MTPRISEQDLVKGALAELSHASPSLTCYTEVAIVGRYADLVTFDGESVTTYEFKLRDWKKGIEQIKDHRLASDFSYLVMPESELSLDAINAAQCLGVGVIAARDARGGGWIMLCESTRSAEVWPALRAQVFRKLASRGVLTAAQEG